MSKYRIFEIAKEFETTSKVILDLLERNNHPARNHMSMVDDEEKTIIVKAFAKKSNVPPTQQARPQNALPRTDNRPPAAQVPPRQPVNPASAPGVQPQRPVSQQPRPAFKPQGQQQDRPYNNNRPSGTPYGSQQGQGRPQGSAPAAGNARPQGTGQAGGQNRPQGGFSQNRPHNAPGNGYQGQQNRPQGQGGGYQGQQNRPQGQGGAGRPAGTGTGAPASPSRTSTGPQRSFTGKGSDAFRDNKKGGGRSGGSNFSSGGNRNNRRGGRPGGQRSATPHVEMPKPTKIIIGETVTVKELAEKMHRDVGDVMKKLLLLGVMVTINQDVDFDTAVLVAGEYQVTVEALPPVQDPTEVPEIVDEPDTLLSRPPVVVVMGHVDHGKTSLLDVIRKTNVTAREAGGITQHIGAYQVNHQGKKIVFLDTPGHAAFTSMRARGAQVTDVAILVVAADDGVMPQTIEAINHAKSAKVPIIVAINKIDKPGANPEHVKQQLSELELIPEDWGGETIMVPVSAHQKTGIPTLLEMILLVAEMQELKANPNRAAQGAIIEAQLDKGRGPVATVLVQKGTLHIGDTIVAGFAYGKVRAMINDRGEKVKKALPSTPVEVLGLSDVPQAGDILYVTDEKTARSVAEKRIAKKRTDELQLAQKVSLDDIFRQIQEGKLKELNIVVKADVQGTVEALRQSLQSIKSEEVRVVVVHAGVGAINESDVMLASASNAIIIGFNVRPDNNARKAAEQEKVDVRLYRVIYDAINDMEAAMKGMLAPKFKEVIQGKAEVRQLITISKLVIAGCYVLEGKITSSSKMRVIRDSIVIHEGEIESLRRFKDDVKEVATGFECGILVEKFRDYRPGDVLEAYTMEEIR